MNGVANARGGAALYTPQILALSVELADYPLTDDLSARGDANSRLCGSRVIVGVACDVEGTIARVGARVTACAIGQAAAALFLRSAKGCKHGDLAQAQAEIEAWLAGANTLPTWPGLAALAPARHYPARHAAMLLPWKAGLAALSNRPGAD